MATSTENVKDIRDELFNLNAKMRQGRNFFVSCPKSESAFCDHRNCYSCEHLVDPNIVSTTSPKEGYVGCSYNFRNFLNGTYEIISVRKVCGTVMEIRYLDNGVEKVWGSYPEDAKKLDDIINETEGRELIVFNYDKQCNFLIPDAKIYREKIVDMEKMLGIPERRTRSCVFVGSPVKIEDWDNACWSLQEEK